MRSTGYLVRCLTGSQPGCLTGCLTCSQPGSQTDCPTGSPVGGPTGSPMPASARAAAPAGGRVRGLGRRSPSTDRGAGLGPRRNGRARERVLARVPSSARRHRSWGRYRCRFWCRRHRGVSGRSGARPRFRRRHELSTSRRPCRTWDRSMSSVSVGRQPSTAPPSRHPRRPPSYSRASIAPRSGSCRSGHRSMTGTVTCEPRCRHRHRHRHRHRGLGSAGASFRPSFGRSSRLRIGRSRPAEMPARFGRQESLDAHPPNRVEASTTVRSLPSCSVGQAGDRPAARAAPTATARWPRPAR